jgi:hypothetical protein
MVASAVTGKWQMPCFFINDMASAKDSSSSIVTIDRLISAQFHFRAIQDPAPYQSSSAP